MGRQNSIFFPGILSMYNDSCSCSDDDMSLVDVLERRREEYPLGMASIRMHEFVDEVQQVFHETGKLGFDAEKLRVLYREYRHPEKSRGWTAHDIDQCHQMLVRIGFLVDCPVEFGQMLPPDTQTKSGEPVERANLFVWRGCGQALGIDMDGLLRTMDSMHCDKEKWSSGKNKNGKQNKVARHTFCVTDLNEPVINPDQGDVNLMYVRHKHPKNPEIKFTNYRFAGELEKFRRRFARVLGPFGYKFNGQFAELNKYYAASCGIGWHGDVGRGHGTDPGAVSCLKVGRAIPLCFGWYRNSRPVAGSALEPSGPVCFPPVTKKGMGWQSTTVVACLMLGHGDMYMMSRKSIGYDWKKKDYALRHSAGHYKYTMLNKALYATVPTAGAAYSLTFSDVVENDSELQFSTPYAALK